MVNKISVVQLTLTLNNWKPRIWRRIWMRDDTRLDKVSMYLYSSMSWCGYHLSDIKTKNASYGDTSIDEPLPEMLNWKKYTLRDLINQKIKQFKYYYDFGDSWEMTVNMSVQKKLDPEAPYPVCVNGENAAPPEDIGSYPGYEEFIEVMKNPKHKEYKVLAKWWGHKNFDPSHFSVDETNDDIQDAIEFIKL